MRQKGVASVQERRIVGGAVSPAPLSGVKPPGPSQERDQKEGKQLRPVRVNLTSGDESGGTRRQISGLTLIATQAKSFKIGPLI
ncbi:hypothetical protein T02_7284 [Trichinella nativa]|uniref:Uncharacterized protein n=1 Tax=Trichinella nativa TaxID=6335 RepID=A0A0V1KMR1_9BILA|nr:hypothetical protein T02_13378 [Trichinella nativa]KRZ48270.1 hypothetical protein T02_7284 [Trichinella nativa]